MNGKLTLQWYQRDDRSDAWVALENGVSLLSVYPHDSRCRSWDINFGGVLYEGHASAEEAALRAEYLFAHRLETWVKDMGGRVVWPDEDVPSWRAGETVKNGHC